MQETERIFASLKKNREFFLRVRSARLKRYNSLKNTYIKTILFMVLFCGAYISSYSQSIAKNNLSIKPSSGSFTIIKNSKAKAVIVLPDSSSKEVKEAVKFFNECLKKSRETQLTVVNKIPKNANAIVFEVKKDSNLLVEDNFELNFLSAKLLQIKCSKTSARWAVNFLLKEHGGFDWLFPGIAGEVYPDSKDFVVPAVNVKKEASFKLRRSYWHVGSDLVWMKALNGKKGISINHEMFKHAFPYKIQRRPFPEYVKPTIKGKKFTPKTYAQYWQPCMTNKKCLDEAVKNIFIYLKKNPDIRSISMGINDSGGFCECRNCLAQCTGKKNLVRLPDKSELYYTWLNEIASRVCEKYPNLYIGCLVYREVMTPPSFKLHKNIVPVLTIDVFACSFPDIKTNREKLIKAWSQKAENLCVWNYAWGPRVYTLPRISFKVDNAFYKFFKKHKGNASFGEAIISYFEGPKKYLYYNQLWNIDLDLDKTLNDWYTKCVGKKSGEYLKEYFAFWEKFWISPEAKKTPWYNLRKEIYMQDNASSYLYAVKKSEMEHCRILMGNVLKFAVTDRQKVRARKMINAFEHYEACYYGYSADIIPVSMKLSNAEQAVAIINNISKAVNYLKKKHAFMQAMVKEPPFNNVWVYKTKGGKYNSTGLKLEAKTDFAPVLNAISKTMPFIENPKVVESIAKIVKNKTLPRDISALLCSLKDLKDDKKDGV